MKFLLAIFSFIGLFAFGQDTLKLYYEINQYKLKTSQKDKLDKHFKTEEIAEVSIVGYTDYLGTKEYNQDLSSKRAKQVSSYLKTMKLVPKNVAGSGETGTTLNSKKGIKENRRVEVIFKRKKKMEQPKVDVAIRDTLSIDVENIEVGDKLVLNNMNFIPGRHYLVMEAKPELSRLIDIMLKNPTLKIELHGHICCETDHADGWDVDAMNYNLSVNRAKYIYDQLVKNGVSKERLKYKGFGRSNPLFPLELDDNQKAKNRRVEILIIEK